MLCAALVAAFGGGCTDRDASCPDGGRQFALKYTGDIQGEGALEYQVSGGHSAQITLSVKVPTTAAPNPEAQPTVQLRGAGTCKNGQVSAVFAAAPGEVVNRYRVLGGLTVLVLSPELLEGSFGFWQVDLHDSKENHAQRLHGYFEETHGSGAAAVNQP